MMIISALQVSGPLDRSQVQFFVETCGSIHQYQPVDDFHVIFLTQDQAYMLSAEPLANIVDYLQQYRPDQDLTRHLTVLQAGIKIKPRPEPEVAAARPASASEPEAITSRWRARIRTKFRSGHVHEEAHPLVSIDDLDGIIEHSPHYLSEIKNIKIKLEYQI